MEIVYGIGAVWVAAATLVTFGLAHAAADRPFSIEDAGPRSLTPVGR